MLLVDRRQLIDVEQNQRDGVAKPAGALELLGEDGVEQRPRVERRQLVDDRGVAGFELGALRVGGEQVERRAPDQLGDERPGLAGRAERVVQRQLVEGGAFGEIGEREQPFHRQCALEHDAVQIGDEAAARIEAAVAQRNCQQLRQQQPEASAVIAVERLGAAVGKMATVSAVMTSTRSSRIDEVC